MSRPTDARLEIQARVRAEAARLVGLAGQGGVNIKHQLVLAARALGITPRRARSFREQTADPLAWELETMREREEALLRARANALQLELTLLRRRLTKNESGLNSAGNPEDNDDDINDATAPLDDSRFAGGRKYLRE